MYINKILYFQESMTILNAHMKKSLETYCMYLVYIDILQFNYSTLQLFLKLISFSLELGNLFIFKSHNEIYCLQIRLNSMNFMVYLQQNLKCKLLINNFKFN